MMNCNWLYTQYIRKYGKLVEEVKSRKLSLEMEITEISKLRKMDSTDLELTYFKVFGTHSL